MHLLAPRAHLVMMCMRGTGSSGSVHPLVDTVDGGHTLRTRANQEQSDGVVCLRIYDYPDNTYIPEIRDRKHDLAAYVNG